MNSFLLIFSIFIALTACAPPEVHFANRNAEGAYVDRNCGSNLESLWLDIVFVVDNSQIMEDSGLNQVAWNIVQVVMELTIGLDPNNPKTSRVGIVTYNSEATIIASLDAFDSTSDLLPFVLGNLSHVANTTESYLSKGLTTAARVLQNGYRDDRKTVKQVIIVFAASFQTANNNDPVPIANRLKANHITIVTVGYGRGNDITKLLQELSLVSSPSANFAYFDANLIGSLQTVLVDVNCFCPPGWSQFYDGPVKKGVCVRASSLFATWVAAKLTCHNLAKNGYLVNEYSQEKHDFVFDVVRKTPGFQPPYQYYIGLSYFNYNWNWEQPFGLSSRPFTNNTWTDWINGVPPSVPSFVMNTQLDTSNPAVGWGVTNRNNAQSYVCEVASCDTNNYCAGDY